MRRRGPDRLPDPAGLHGACDDPETCPHAPPGAGRGGPGAYLARLPADTLLVSVRCHV
ncbi:hypothetical protein [Streptomyces sp. 147326]|uniref:hypothetical protein n=1 Tax=Streptomyces sp. 147326 TaxID=3074379 RepID=UPI003857E092